MPYRMLSCCRGVFLGGLLDSLLKNASVTAYAKRFP